MAQPNLRCFDLPPSRTWGRKRHLGCINAAELRLDVPPNPDPINPPPPPPAAAAPAALEDGLERIRRKLMAHIRHAADKLNRTAPCRQPTDSDGEEVVEPKVEIPPSTTVVRRQRRSARPSRREPSPSPSPPPPPPPVTTRSSRARSAAASAKKQRRRFSVALSREEIDEDFYAFTGRRASGRPKRRPPAIRKHVDLLFPGLGLAEITAASYQVAEPRGRSCVV